MKLTVDNLGEKVKIPSMHKIEGTRLEIINARLCRTFVQVLTLTFDRTL
jgi:hypothetical protein